MRQRRAFSRVRASRRTGQTLFCFGSYALLLAKELLDWDELHVLDMAGRMAILW